MVDILSLPIEINQLINDYATEPYVVKCDEYKYTTNKRFSNLNQALQFIVSKLKNVECWINTNGYRICLRDKKYWYEPLDNERESPDCVVFMYTYNYQPNCDTSTIDQTLSLFNYVREKKHREFHAVTYMKINLPDLH